MRRTAVVTIVVALVVGTLAVGSGDAFAARGRKQSAQADRQPRPAKKDSAKKDGAKKDGAKKDGAKKDGAKKDEEQRPPKSPPSGQEPPKERTPEGKPQPDGQRPAGTEPMKLACGGGTPEGQATIGCGWSRNDSPAFVGYRLWKQVGDDVATRHVAFRTHDRSVTTYHDRDVVAGQVHHYRIDAVDRDGNVIAHSAVFTVKCCEPAEPKRETRPVRLECVGGSPEGRPGIGCRWSPFEFPEFGAYRLWRSTGGADQKAVVFTTPDRAVTHYFDREVESGRGYAYAVEVIDRNGKTLAHSEVVKVACCGGSGG